MTIQTTKTVEHLDQQVEEQEKLRQNARSISTIIQRIKVQLIAIHPTLTNEGDQKLKVHSPFLLFSDDSYLV